MADGEGFKWTVLRRAEDFADVIELEQLDAAGEEFAAEGPGGCARGDLAETLTEAAGEGSDSAWLDATVAAIRRQLAGARRGANLLVLPASGQWFHTTASRNRESIRRHGLDWRRMTPPGIAGSRAAEAEGIFLCRELESAEWFAGMCREPPADVWSVSLVEGWLQSAPDDNGAGDWMICPAPIAPKQIRLFRSDLAGGR